MDRKRDAWHIFRSEYAIRDLIENNKEISRFSLAYNIMAVGVYKRVRPIEMTLIIHSVDQPPRKAYYSSAPQPRFGVEYDR